MMLSHGARVIGNLLEMATTSVTIDTTSHTPLLDQVTKMIEVEVEDHETRNHLYEV